MHGDYSLKVLVTRLLVRFESKGTSDVLGQLGPDKPGGEGSNMERMRSPDGDVGVVPVRTDVESTMVVDDSLSFGVPRVSRD